MVCNWSLRVDLILKIEFNQTLQSNTISSLLWVRLSTNIFYLKKKNIFKIKARTPNPEKSKVEADAKYDRTSEQVFIWFIKMTILATK